MKVYMQRSIGALSKRHGFAAGFSAESSPPLCFVGRKSPTALSTHARKARLSRVQLAVQKT